MKINGRDQSLAKGVFPLTSNAVGPDCLPQKPRSDGFPPSPASGKPGAGTCSACGPKESAAMGCAACEIMTGSTVGFEIVLGNTGEAFCIIRKLISTDYKGKFRRLKKYINTPQKVTKTEREGF